MFLYLGGLLDTPCLYTPLTFVCPLYICMPPVHLYTPQGCTHPPGPPCFCAPAWFWHIACCGGVVFLYWDTPSLFGGAFPLNYNPHPPLLVLCALLFSGISVLMWAFPLLLKGLGCSPHHWGGLGWHISSSAVHILILLHFL